MQIFGLDITRRASLENPTTPLSNPAKWLTDLFAGNSDTGIEVTPKTALQYSAVWAAVRVLSESVAQLPVHIYTIKKNRRVVLNDSRAELLQFAPNSEMTSFTFRETLQAHILTYGNAYALIQRDGRGALRSLWPLLPDKVGVDRINGEVIYKVNQDDGKDIYLAAKDVLHVKGLGFNGLVGYSPITMHAQSIGLGMAAAKYGARFFKNGGSVSGVLESPLPLNQEVVDRLRKQFNDNYAGLDNAHSTMVLEQGLKYQKIGITPEDAQLLATRKFEVTDIARIYRIPQHMLNDTTGMTFGNMEQRSIEFVQHSLVPWLIRWEQEVKKKILNKGEYLKFSVDGLQRGDINSRYAAYSTGIQNGFLTPNEVREMEERDPVKGGDVNLIPMNLIPTTTIRDKAVERVSNREKIEFIRCKRKYLDNNDAEGFSQSVDNFLEKHSQYLSDHLCVEGSVARTYITSLQEKILSADDLELMFQTWNSKSELLKLVINNEN